tara:strand:- start:284 stop:1207 length:924 start_codon:yes stop_codon:yes gene_type:complete
MEFSLFKNIKTAYLAPKNFLEQLTDELEDVQGTHGLLVCTNRPPQTSFWVQNIWLSPKIIKIQSINDAARKLKEIQRNWSLYSCKLHRRANLIQEKLPKISAKPIRFPTPLPKSLLGSWTLLDSETILASAECSSFFPNGEMHFVEDKLGPPNRAYLKLQEALTLSKNMPQPGEFCIDAGASPGGWTWVLYKLNTNVLAVDRAPLDCKFANLRRVKYRKGNAFTLHPDEFKDYGVDWLFCDVACYPEKLYPWVKQWVESGVCRNMICTIKFQGKDPYALLQSFANIPKSQIIRLFNNKHELTWVYRQ